MRLNKKRKQHPSLISARAIKSHKHRKIDQENIQKKRFSRKRREKDNFWDELKKLHLESSSDKSNIENSSLNKCCSNKNNLKIVNKQKNNIYKELGDQDREVQLGVEEYNLRPVWKNDAGSYL